MDARERRDGFPFGEEGGWAAVDCYEIDDGQDDSARPPLSARERHS